MRRACVGRSAEPSRGGALWAAALWAFASAGCGAGGGRGRDDARAPALGGGSGPAVATVAGEPVTADEVAAVARDEGLSDPRAALGRAVALRLLAREARRRGLDRDPLAADTARRATLQALLLATVEREVRPETLPAPDVARAMSQLGFEISHGELWRTQHVVVRPPGGAGPAAPERAAARGAAEAARRALAALPGGAAARPEDFARAVNAAAAGVRACGPSHEVRVTCRRVETLPPMDRGGRAGAAGEYHPAYAAAAAALGAPGDVSPVVETSFGYHVIALMERLPARERPEAEVRARVTEEILRRARARAFDGLLAAARARLGGQVRDEALRAVETARLDDVGGGDGPRPAGGAAP